MDWQNQNSDNRSNFAEVLLFILVIVMTIIGYRVGKENGYKKAVAEVCSLADYQTDFCQIYLRDFVLPEAQRTNKK